MTDRLTLWSDDRVLVEQAAAAVSDLQLMIVAQTPPSPGDWVSQLLAARPIAVVLDLDTPDLQWARGAASLKQTAATRRLPILAVTADPTRMTEEALAAGCDAVVDRAAIHDLAAAVRRWAVRPDPGAIAVACAEPLSAAALEGIAHFNRGEFFEAHEYLEEAWNTDPGPGRTLYRGLLQIAVAYLHITRANPAGATKLFLRMWQWLDDLPGRCRGVDVDAARRDARAARDALAGLTPEHIDQFDRTLLKPWSVSHARGD